jgi:hypothetical protein
MNQAHTMVVPADKGSFTANAYIALVIGLGCLGLAHSLQSWHPAGLTSILVYCALSALASTVKLQLPGITGTVSPGFVLILFGIVSLDLPVVMLAGALGVVAQCIWHAAKRPRLARVCLTSVA